MSGRVFYPLFQMLLTCDYMSLNRIRCLLLFALIRYQPIDSIHHSLSADFDNHQELNELSLSPRNADSHLITGSRHEDRQDSCMSNDESGWSGRLLSHSVKSYLSGVMIHTRLRKWTGLAPDSLVTICVTIMVILIFLLCSLGPTLIQVRVI